MVEHLTNLVEGNIEVCCSGMTKNQLKKSTTAGEICKIFLNWKKFGKYNLYRPTYKNPDFESIWELGKELVYKNFSQIDL